MSGAAWLGGGAGCSDSMNVATTSPIKRPIMLENSTTFTRRSASRRSTGDILVGHTQRRFTPRHAEPHLLFVADECAKPCLVISRHPNEFDAGRPPGYPSDHA